MVLRNWPCTVGSSIHCPCQLIDASNPFEFDSDNNMFLEIFRIHLVMNLTDIDAHLGLLIQRSMLKRAKKW